jgi:hypothetical protein
MKVRALSCQANYFSEMFYSSCFCYVGCCFHRPTGNIVSRIEATLHTGLSKMLGQVLGLKSPHLNKDKFEVQPQRSLDLSPLYLNVWDTSKPQIINPRYMWKDAAVHNEEWLWVHWLRWSSFWIFVVNRDLINNENSTVIKLGTCIVNILCYL